jgi:hypothetical protein
MFPNTNHLFNDSESFLDIVLFIKILGIPLSFRNGSKSEPYLKRQSLSRNSFRLEFTFVFINL